MKDKSIDDKFEEEIQAEVSISKFYQEFRTYDIKLNQVEFTKTFLNIYEDAIGDGKGLVVTKEGEKFNIYKDTVERYVEKMNVIVNDMEKFFQQVVVYKASPMYDELSMKTQEDLEELQCITFKFLNEFEYYKGLLDGDRFI